MKMKILLMSACFAITSPVVACAEGVLNIFNWGDYTPPDMIKKFEEKYDVKVTITDYDSNDTALAKVRQGGHGFDIVVPSGAVMNIWINEGLLLESRPDKMENFKNVDPKWVDVPFDPGRHYSVPWTWGAMGVTVNKSVYSGDPNTSALILDPPPELAGKVNVFPEMSDVMYIAIAYVGGQPCTSDKEVLRKVRDTLVAAKQKWVSMDFSDIAKYAKGDFAAGLNYSGPSLRARQQNDQIVFGYPKEGYPIFSDNVAILKDAKNVENAKLFQNFIMDPENAAMIAKFNGYPSAIDGVGAFLPDDMKNAPEINVPPELAAKGGINLACPAEVQDLYTRIWTDLLK